MCERCQSCNHCDSYSKRRCASCSSTYPCDPCQPCESSCSTARSHCTHRCWTCPCCCRKYFRSHSVCGLFPNSSSDCNEYKLFGRHLTGHYLKLQNSSVTNLYTSTYDLRQKDGKTYGMQSKDTNNKSSRRRSRRDNFCLDRGMPGCARNVLKILQQQNCDNNIYDNINDIPFTFFPKKPSAGSYDEHTAHVQSDYWAYLKRRLLSCKENDDRPRKLLDNKFLQDLNKLYATVGGGIKESPKQEPYEVPHESQTSYYPNPAEAMYEYRVFFDKHHPRRRRSSPPKRRSSTYRRRSSVRYTHRRSTIRDMAEKYNWPMYARFQYPNSWPPLASERSGVNKESTRLQTSDYVIKYPTKLDPMDRARLSTSVLDRQALMGSLLSTKGRPVNVAAYERRHTLHMGTD